MSIWLLERERESVSQINIGLWHTTHQHSAYNGIVRTSTELACCSMRRFDWHTNSFICWASKQGMTNGAYTQQNVQSQSLPSGTTHVLSGDSACYSYEVHVAKILNSLTQRHFANLHNYYQRFPTGLHSINDLQDGGINIRQQQYCFLRRLTKAHNQQTMHSYGTPKNIFQPSQAVRQLA